jgi:hypothetical protein
LMDPQILSSGFSMEEKIACPY